MKALVSSLPIYRIKFSIYLDLTSTASQNLMPSLSGLFAMCCVNLQHTSVGNSCSSTVIFSPDL